MTHPGRGCGQVSTVSFRIHAPVGTMQPKAQYKSARHPHNTWPLCGLCAVLQPAMVGAP